MQGKVAQHIFLFLCITCVLGENVVVTVQSQSQAEMDAMTEQIDAMSGPSRVTLGAIEATMSRVVDSDIPYTSTEPLSVPTLSILRDINFDSDLQTWTLEYSTMRSANEQLNAYDRVLYFSKQTFVSHDLQNPCLATGIENDACLQQLAQDYVVPSNTLQTGQDYITYDGNCDSGRTGCEITSTVQNEPNSLTQTVVVTIPHHVLKTQLSKVEEMYSEVYGTQTVYSFGIGMVFLLSGHNIVMFDEFDVVENSLSQLAWSKRNSYAVAKHVSFFTKTVAALPQIRVAVIEYLLDEGQTLLQLDAALNGRQINATDCADMQAQVDALSNPQCISTHPLCTPVTYSTAGSSQVWASYVIPIPTWHTLPSLAITTMLTTNDTRSNSRILSNLNFDTSNSPTPACEDVVAVSFDATQYVDSFLYRGHALHVENIQGSFTVSNDTSLGITESLMTIVLQPQDSDAAFDYFERYTDERIVLDNVYMSHSLDSDLLPTTLSNSATGLANGRSTLNLDANLLSVCPMESLYLYSDPLLTCVTTHDWSLSGQIQRPVSAHSAPACPACAFFVREVGIDEDEDIAWLMNNVFGSSSPHASSTFYAAVRNLVPDTPRNIRAHAKTYWILPLYMWPSRGPIGLQDRTIVSISFSIEKAVAGSRRLLSSAVFTRQYAHEPHKLLNVSEYQDQTQVSLYSILSRPHNQRHVKLHQRLMRRPMHDPHMIRIHKQEK